MYKNNFTSNLRDEFVFLSKNFRKILHFTNCSSKFAVTEGFHRILYTVNKLPTTEELHRFCIQFTNFLHRIYEIIQFYQEIYQKKVDIIIQISLLLKNSSNCIYKDLNCKQFQIYSII